VPHEVVDATGVVLEETGLEFGARLDEDDPEQSDQIEEETRPVSQHVKLLSMSCQCADEEV
jgi:hypothetical protein